MKSLIKMDTIARLGRLLPLGIFAALTFASLAPRDASAAAGLRFLREDFGDRVDTATDNELVATKVRWYNETNLTPVTWYLFREPYGSPTSTNRRVLPLRDPNLDPVPDWFIQDRMTNSLREWNESNAEDFSFAEYITFTDQAFSPQEAGFPQSIGLDMVNLVSFLDPVIALPPPSPEGVVLAVTTFWFFNQDVDLSDIDNIPPFVLSFNTVDAQLDLDFDGIVDLTLPSNEFKAGTLIDSDIVFNQDLSDFWVLPPADPDAVTDAEREELLGAPDIEGIWTHELGHAAGLAHTTVLQAPTMTPFLTADVDPYDVRELDFDDKVSLKINYSGAFDRLGRGAIQGRIIDGDAVDGAPPFPVAEIENTPVFLGRPNDDNFTHPDDVFAVDHTTSFTRKIRLVTEVLNSPFFRAPLGINAPIERDNRYFFPGLPTSDQPFPVEIDTENPSQVLPASDYAVYIQPPLNLVNDVQAAFPPDPNRTPPEFYGGLLVPFALPGAVDQVDNNTPNDRLVQDERLQFAFTNLGQFALRLTNTVFQLIDDLIEPTESYITYRIRRPDGTVKDVANFRPYDIVPVDPSRPMLEVDTLNFARGSYIIDNALVSTQTLEIGNFTTTATGGMSEFRVTVDVGNITDAALEAGLRFMIRPTLGGQSNLRFFVGDSVLARETTLIPGQIPGSFFFGTEDNQASCARMRGIGIVTGTNSTFGPDKLQFANFSNIAQFGRTNPRLFDYETNNSRIFDAAYAVQFDPKPIGPGQITSFSTIVTVNLGQPFEDGLFAGPTGQFLPGEEEANVYTPVPVQTNSVTCGVDILTNTGTPGTVPLDPGTTDTDPVDPGTTATLPDRDSDGIPNDFDNCPDTANPQQTDQDADGAGDVCDPDFVSFTDISPIAPNNGRVEPALPNTPFITLGAAFGDVNNDGYADLAIANGAPVGASPSSLVNRLYISIPAPSATEPNGRRFVDQTFGQDGIVGNEDDRLPADIEASADVKFADFDNDGDLDLYVSNFSSQIASFVGAPNRFYENLDVNDPTVNPTPDGDNFGDGFYVDVSYFPSPTDGQIWDPGILNQQPVGAPPQPYDNALSEGGGVNGGWDISSHSDVGDIDNDGDIDVVVANRNAFLDIIASGVNSPDGQLRFSERTLINHTLEPSSGAVQDVPGRVTRFADETLGPDNVFGGLDLFGFSTNDRLPPLKPRIPSRTPTAPVDEIDFSNTNAVKLSHFFQASSQNPAGFFSRLQSNCLSIIVFDQRNGGIESGGVQTALGPWDGDDLVYTNQDVNFDTQPDGIFRCFNYGVERNWLLADDGTTLSIGIPEGIDGDITVNENDTKSTLNDNTQFGLVFDSDFTGWNEIFAFNGSGGHIMHTNREYATRNTEFSRGRGVGFVSSNLFAAIDYVLSTSHQGSRRPADLQLPNGQIGRPRGATTQDFNLDGLPDIFVANDAPGARDVVLPNQPPGFKTIYLNRDALGSQEEEWLVASGDAGGDVGSLITNEIAAAASFAVSEDMDMDGDSDVFSPTFGSIANLYRNNNRTAGLSPTTPGNNPNGFGLQNYDPDDAPLFVDQTYTLLPPYMGGSFDVGAYQDFFNASNITLDIDLSDMDRDGDLDLTFANGGIFSAEGDFQVLYKNNGKLQNEGMKVFTPAPAPFAAPYLVTEEFNIPWLSDEPSPAHGVKFVDVNNDGGPDIVFSNNGDQPRIFMNVDEDDPLRNGQPDADAIPDGIYNEESDRIPLFADVTRTFSRRFAVGDVNNDGLPDIVIANGVQDNGAPNVVLINQAAQPGFFVDESDSRLPRLNTNGSLGPVLDDTTDVALVDVDNDADLDIIFVNRLVTNQTEPRPNFFPYCRLLINTGAGFFGEVLPPGPWATRISPPAPSGYSWPLHGIEFDGQGILVGDFMNRGERSEDINGNGILDGPEDMNNNRVLDFDDTRTANGRHDNNYDIVVLTADTHPNTFLENTDSNGDGFGDGAFVDQTAARFPGLLKFPTHGGDVGDVNRDGLLDIAFAIDSNPLSEANTRPQTKIPVQLLFNTASTTIPAGGLFVDGSGHDLTSTSPVIRNFDRTFGELPELKTQLASGQYLGFVGNARQVKFADIDRDLDLDMVIGEAGRVGGSGPPFGGWANFILQNKQIGEDFNSRRVLSVRDPGGPILRSVSPSRAAQGQRTLVVLYGERFAGSPTVDFGPGITIVGPTQVYLGQYLNVLIDVADNAPLGSHTIKVTNPDGQVAYTGNRSFFVLPKGSIAETAAKGWEKYE